MAEPILTVRQLNRALLARQMLLERHDASPLQALERLVALQGQFPRAPFIGLWSRLKGFEPKDLNALIDRREVVRATMMRGTLHLMTAEDFLAFRPNLRTSEALTLPGGKRTSVAELEPYLKVARKHFAEPRDFESLRQEIVGDAGEEVRMMAFAARILLPLVQASSEGPWGFTAGGEFVLAKAWLDRDVAPKPDPQSLVRRYLAAYGPATPGDFAAWSGEKGAAAHFEALGDELLRFRDERKRILFDLKDAQRPEVEGAAPPRLLPDFDAAVLGHQDRSRIIPPEIAPHVATSKNLLVPPLVLVDGFVAGGWRLDTKRKAATVTIRCFRPLTKQDRAGLESEALALLEAFEPDRQPEVVFAEG